jgi:pyridoxamine 5'-phosphate oxidase family protein
LNCDGWSGQPAPCGAGRLPYNAGEDAIDIGGHSFATRKKYRDVEKNQHVAFVVDDLASTDPWRPRGVEIRGEAEILLTGGSEVGRGFDPDMFRVRPRRIISWGLTGDAFTPNARSV